MTEEPDDDRRCDYCGEVVGAVPWILLNRYMLGTGTNSAAFQRRCSDGYLWETQEGQKVATGALLHWPTCALPFIEGEMIETDFTCR